MRSVTSSSELWMIHEGLLNYLFNCTFVLWYEGPGNTDETQLYLIKCFWMWKLNVDYEHAEIGQTLCSSNKQRAQNPLSWLTAWMRAIWTQLTVGYPEGCCFPNTSVANRLIKWMRLFKEIRHSLFVPKSVWAILGWNLAECLTALRLGRTLSVLRWCSGFKKLFINKGTFLTPFSGFW